MIRFLAPWAAAGVLLLAGPLLVHMLLRRHARRVTFPAMKFLVETRTAAVRLRHPSDIGLLTLRLAIVGAAIVAAAHPIVITPWRLAQWDARVIRAVVVDTSASVRGSAEIDRFAEQELTAFRAQRFEGADLREQLARAGAWFGGAPPGRREVVILSDFQRGALDREDLILLPPSAGIRTIRAGMPPRSRDVRLPPVGGFRGGVWEPSVRLDAGGTAVTWTKASAAPPLTWLTTAQAEGEREAASRAVHAAVSAGVAAGDDRRRVLVRFAGAPADSGDRQPIRTAWMLEAALALRGSSLLRQTNASVRTSEQAGQLVVETNVAATSLDAPAVVRAVVLAMRPAAIADREAEVAALPDAELALWRREAAPVSAGPYSVTESDADGRWFWAIALALLAVESWLRRRHMRSSTEQVRDAA
jgi:hypothetical protein